MAGQPRRSQDVESSPSRIPMSLTLLLALGALLAWLLVLLFTPVTTGVIHLLLAVGATLLVRWWAVRE